MNGDDRAHNTQHTRRTPYISGVLCKWWSDRTHDVHVELGIESLAHPGMCVCVWCLLLCRRLQRCQMLRHQLDVGSKDGNPLPSAQVMDVVVANIHRGTLVSTEQSTSLVVTSGNGRASRQARPSASATAPAPHQHPHRTTLRKKNTTNTEHSDITEERRRRRRGMRRRKKSRRTRKH